MSVLNHFQLSLFALLFSSASISQAFAAIRAAEDYEWLFPEKPAEGVELDPVDTYDSVELNALVKEVTEYHYGFSCTDFDTIPLLAPDGEYRALLILFSLDPELDDSYSSFLELSNQERNFLRLMGVAVKDDDYELVEYYRQSAIEYRVMLDSYYTFFVASVDKSLIPLGSIRNIDIKVNEDNFTRDNLIFKDLGLLPSPDFYKSTSGNNYSVVSVAEDEAGQRYWYKIPESELVDKLWLLYVPEHSCDWKDWSVFSSLHWPIQSFNDFSEDTSTYPNAHPNAQELMANSSSPDNIRRMLTCPEADDDGTPPGYHYAYSDDQGHIECAVDNAGLVRAEDADFNHDRFNVEEE